MFHTAPVRRTAAALGASALMALLLAAPAAARIDPGNGFGPVTTQQAPPPPGPSTDGASDTTVEYLQLGAGLLAGITLTGAGAAWVARRRHEDLRTA